MAEFLIALALLTGLNEPPDLRLPSFKQLQYRFANVQKPVQPLETAEDREQAYQKEMERRRLRDERIAKARIKYGQKRSFITQFKKQTRSTRLPKPNFSQPIDMSVFTPEMTLSEALNEIQKAGLPLVIIWSDLKNNAFVDQETPIGLQARGVTSVSHALKLVLVSVAQGGSKVGFVEENGVVTVATRNLQIASRQLKVYDVAELTNPGWWFPQQGGYGMGQMGQMQQGYSGMGMGMGR